MYFKNIRILHMGGKGIFKLHIATSELELEQQIYLGLVSELPRKIQGHSFSQCRPSHFSYVYSINRDKTLPFYYLAICCK